MKKQCKRKLYPLVNPITVAISGACITPQHDLAKLRTRELLALDNMVHGKGGLRDWAELVDVNNMAEVMAENGIGPEVLPYCAVAEKALIEAQERFKKTKKWGLSAVGIQAIKEVIEYAHLQQSSIARSEFEKMIDKTLAKIRNKGRGVYEVR